ncbi:TIGR00282 family metallophosphoesterase [Candidatus Berkelbacteria bacterium]|nr:TIGR00282 family metallophosphoesterase [Candidatus Berkelbacteria bacterium]
MRILFIGDIFGRPGREAVKKFLPEIKEQEQIDFTIANGENARHGNGMDLDIYSDLTEAGVDYFTGGDHSFSIKEFLPLMDDPKTRVLRPANYPGAPGRGLAIVEVGIENLTIINLQGRVFMRQQIDNPFLIADQLIKESKGFIFIDFHAEATSEKNTFGHYVDGRVGAVVGTHTHVPTADERILPKGTAYISDVGLTGPRNGSIGADLKQVIPSFTKGLPFKLAPAEGETVLNAIVIETKDNQAISIKRVSIVDPKD